MTFLANNLPNSDQLDMQSLRQAFKSIDSQNTGYLNGEDIEKALKQMNIPEAEIKEMFKSLSHGRTDNIINYSTFLAATIDRKKTLTLQNLQFAFHHFDTRNQGFITKDDIKEVFKREGRKVTEDELGELVGAGDQITFEAFTSSMMEIIEHENKSEPMEI